MPPRVGEAAARLQRIERERRENKLSAAEQRALQKTREEAEELDAHIENLHGGLPPSIALGIFRRDEFRCKRCGGREHLGLHHKGGIQTSKHAYRGKDNSNANLVVICKGCHNAVHEEDRSKLNEE